MPATDDDAPLIPPPDRVEPQTPAEAPSPSTPAEAPGAHPPEIVPPIPDDGSPNETPGEIPLG